jgi:hypothetical protein
VGLLGAYFSSSLGQLFKTLNFLTRSNTMHFTYRTLALIAPLLFAACAVPQRDHIPQLDPIFTAPPTTVIHTYELVVKDSSAQPIEGAFVTYTYTTRQEYGKTASPKVECTTDASGLCKMRAGILLNTKVWERFTTILNYSISKTGFYSNSGTLSASGSTRFYANESPTKGVVTIYKPTDYLSKAFAASAVDRDLRDQALQFMSLIRMQSLIVDADMMLRGMGISSFKSKKYFQMKINTTTNFNSLKLDKYAIGKRLFDDSIRKILNPLNENISNPKSFYGYDLTIYGYTKSFANEYVSPEKIEYRFLIPQYTVRRYKDKDISGQQLLDASVILMNDERIELKLQ